jgi:peptidoglycan/xylan/chitin deacetylase (PgdA/CDA1 family)
MSVSSLGRASATVLQAAMMAAVLGVRSVAAQAAPCPGNADALGTARTLAVDPAATPRVGRKQFPATLPLAPKEVVLTFDDGPWPGTTPKVLDALKRECVHAVFFMLGRNAQANPALARRVLADGHTVAYHTFAHPLLNRLPLDKAEAEIERGVAAVDTVVYGRAGTAPKVPFFRFPGFAASPALLDWLGERHIAVFGADLWASDWNRMTPNQELRLVMRRLDANRGGIVLLHDTKRQTAAMMPAFLHELKASGYRIVHVIADAGKRSQSDHALSTKN